ncbi:aerolysin family beta-barrel pore-forming toxin [Corallococcus sp. M34]|uniref:aerolysin family beta-barrel pore-forming toxin n=1 Tax=Citreicoccus inhibens TaxID=2849499 RepID=UPI001C2229D3|nr:aerolysin family beta-barrel pore-forming toxin [Citreicoccus inhibens]MBU8895758.1 aerolysin family beta-barrel pore-forming toxin [Citreicoccus inhibens]
MSRNGDSLALSAHNGNDSVTVKVLNYADDLQLRELRSARDGSAFAMVNKKTGKALSRASNEQGASLVMKGVDKIDTDDLAVWGNEGRETYNPIYSYADNEQKINILGNGPYDPGHQVVTWEWSGGSDNEKWCQKTDVRKVTVKNINYSLNSALITELSPKLAATQTATNTTGTDQEQKFTFRFTEGHRYSFTHETGLTVSKEIEFKLEIPMLGNSRVTFMAEGTWKFGQKQESTDEHEVSHELTVKVPAHTCIQASVMMLQANVNVPYTAELEYVYADNSVQTVTTTGHFNGVNTTYSIITDYKPIGTPVQNVTRRLLRRM